MSKCFCGLADLPEALGLPAAVGLASECLELLPDEVCAVCSEEFELKPGKPGYANHCPSCSESEANEPAKKARMDADERKTATEANEARRQAMRDLLYRKDS